MEDELHQQYYLQRHNRRFLFEPELLRCLEHPVVHMRRGERAFGVSRVKGRFGDAGSSQMAAAGGADLFASIRSRAG